MPDAAARRARVGPLYDLLVGTESVQDFLADLARLAAEEIDRELSCGLTVQLEGQPMTIASSDDFATELDQVQYTAGEGPCLEAMTTGEPVEVPDVAHAERWPAWRDHGLTHGLTKSLSMPLPTTNGTPLGALNLYSVSAAKLTSDDHEAAVAFAAQAAGAVQVAVRLAEQADLLGHLETALESRAVIDQAKGVLMAQERCTADEAFAILRTASQQRNTKLYDIAAGIVTHVSTPDHTPDDHRR